MKWKKRYEVEEMRREEWSSKERGRVSERNGTFGEREKKGGRERN